MTIIWASRSGILNLVDLAGSERLKKSASEGQRKTEALHINSSLTALGKVWMAQSTIGYRPVYRSRLQTTFHVDTHVANTATSSLHLVNTVKKDIISLHREQQQRCLLHVVICFEGGNGAGSQLRIDACPLPGLEADTPAAELFGRQQFHGGARDGTPYCPVRCRKEFLMLLFAASFNH